MLILKISQLARVKRCSYKDKAYSCIAKFKLVLVVVKVIEIYDSRSGFTELMAKTVFEGVKSVAGAEAEMLRVGTPWSISKLNEVDAIIIGSPTIYGSATSEIRELLEIIEDLDECGKLKLSGKIGGVFGSYGWDGGWVVEKLSSDLENLGIKIVSPTVSLYHEKYLKVSLDEQSAKKCRELGKTVVEKAATKTK